MDKILRPGERTDDLLCKGLKIIQHPEDYCFSIDAVLLANFVRAGAFDRVIDLGTGSAVIPLLLCGKTRVREIVGMELSEEAAQRAQRSVAMNNLEDRITIVCGDVKTAPGIFGTAGFSVAVSNPPYMAVGEGKISPNESKALARHEIALTLADTVKAASKLLKNGGRFYMVHRSSRLAEAMGELRSAGLEPKILRLVAPREGDNPNLFLVMAQKGAGQGIKVQPALIIYRDNGEYTPEILKMYFEELE